MGNKLTFFRMRKDFYDIKQIALLGECNNGFIHQYLYIKMLVMTLETDVRIHFYRNEYFNDLPSQLAVMLNTTPEILTETINNLIQLKLAEYETEDTLKIYKPNRERDRNTQEYRTWRAGVYKRDNYTCKICNMRGVPIEAHHIKPWAKYPEERYNINNGITLCKKCHKNVHKNSLRDTKALMKLVREADK